MAENLLAGVTSYGSWNADAPTKQADGSWLCHTTHSDRGNCLSVLTLYDPVTSDTTLRASFDAKAASASFDASLLRTWVNYTDSSGNAPAVFATYSGTVTTDSWVRLSGDVTVPAGTAVTAFGIETNSPAGEMYVRDLSLAVGECASMSVKASASVTLSWSASIVAVTRYYQLVASTAATPTPPTSADSLGGWTETEPDADTTKVLYTCDRTVFSDGTESWSKASKSTSYEAAKDAKDAAAGAQKTADEAQEQVLSVSTDLSTTANSINATINTKVAAVQGDVDANTSNLDDLNTRLTAEVKTRKSFMNFSEENSSPTLTLGSSDSPAQVKLTNSQLQFLYKQERVAYISSDTLNISNAEIKQQLMMGGFAFVPRQNGNLSLKWVGGDA